MRRGAERLVNICANVRPAEIVVIVTDDQLMHIADVLKEVSLDMKAQPVVIISPPRRIDNEEPAASVAAAMKQADVVFLPVAQALAHTQAVREAIVNGARVISMTAFTEGMMRSGGLFADFKAREPLCRALAHLLSAANRVRVTNPAGTDLIFSIEGRQGNSHACVLDRPGFTAVPNIEANISPLEGSANGLLVVDGSIPYYGVGVIKTPVLFEIQDGSVKKIRGEAQAKYLKALLAAQNDPCVYNIAQFSFGLNPECKDFTGEMLNDEGINGTIHIGIGTSSSLGGKVQAKTHFDAIIRNPSVWLDGECVLELGELKVG